MSLQTDLDRLSVLLRNAEKDEFADYIDIMKKEYTSEADLKIIDDFVSAEAQKIIDETDVLLKELSIRQQLAEVSEMVSLSYIAKNYFHKTRTWLYQRINGNWVNNKPARFTENEIETLNMALKDISAKLGSISVSA